MPSRSKKFPLTMEENCLSALHINRSFFLSLKSVIAFLLAPKIYRILNSQRNVKHGYLESAPRPSRSAPVHQFHTWYFPHSIFWCTNAPHWCTGALHQCTSAQVRCTSALTCKGEFQTGNIISRVALWIYPASSSQYGKNWSWTTTWIVWEEETKKEGKQCTILLEEQRQNFRR